MANLSKPLNQGFAAPSIVANYGPYASVHAAHVALAEDELNVVGMTVGIQSGSSIEEYWYQGGTTEAHLVAKKPDLAAVATSGSYNDLSDKPTIDSSLSESSTNAIQNKAVKAALDGKQDAIPANTYDSYGAASTAKSEIIGGATSDGNTLKKIEDRVSPLESAVGNGGSIDTRIATAKSEIIGDAASDYNTLGKVEDKIQAEASRAAAAEGALDTAKANKATTLAGYGIADAYTKTEVNGLVSTPHQEYVTVATYASLPVTGSADTIYRVSNYDGSQSQVDASVYSEYAWDGTQYVFLRVEDSTDEVFDISVYNSNAIYADLAAALGTNGANVPSGVRKPGMSVKFVTQVRPASYTVVKTEGLDSQPTGTELATDPDVESGTYNASQLTAFSTLPTSTGAGNAVTYWMEVAGDTTTYTSWVVTMVQTSDNKYVRYNYLLTDATTNSKFTNVANWQGVDVTPTAGSDNLVKSGGVYTAIQDNPQIGCYECSTAAGNASKVVAANGYVLPTSGGSIKIKMVNANTANNATLNINNKGSKALYYNGVRASSTNSWDAGEVVEVYYDPTANSNAGGYFANNVAGGGGDGIYDISAANSGATYNDLSAALGRWGANVPARKRKSDMSVKFIQSSDNKYVQYRYMLADVSTVSTFTNVANWCKTDNDYQSKNVTLIYTRDFIPNIDTVNGVIDFGDDPVLFIGHEVYALRWIHSDPTKYRAVNYMPSGSSAGTLIFNKDTKEFGTKAYNSTFADNEVIIGTIRTDILVTKFNGANFPFEFTIDGVNKVEYSYSSVTTLEKLSYANFRGNVEIIAHRGVHVNDIPENSLDAFRYAGYLGYDKAETDFCPTSDGVLVLMHDESINRTMKNASDYSDIAETVNVVDKTYAELKAGYVLASSDKRYRRPIPTLEEYFKVCKESGVFPLPEIKMHGTTQAHVLEAFNMGCEIMGEGNFGFCSFSAALLDYARTLSDITPLYYITNDIVDTVNSISGESRNDKHNVWYPSYAGITEQKIKAHHKKGIRVVTWTVPKGNYAGQIKLGCDGVASDIIAPNPSSLMIKAINGLDDLTTNGTIVNNKLILNNGQTATYSYSKRIYLGAFYMSVICKGSFRIGGVDLFSTIEAEESERFIFRSLIVNNIPSFYITSYADGLEVEFVEYYIQKF